MHKILKCQYFIYKQFFAEMILCRSSIAVAEAKNSFLALNLHFQCVLTSRTTLCHVML